MRRDFLALALAGLLLAQLTPPGSYNLGVPAVPGTRVPESNAATAVTPPQFSAPASTTAPAAGTGSVPSVSPSTGPAYSFGAAPPSVVSPGR